MLDNQRRCYQLFALLSVLFNLTRTTKHQCSESTFFSKERISFVTNSDDRATTSVLKEKNSSKLVKANEYRRNSIHRVVPDKVEQEIIIHFEREGSILRE